MPKATEPKKIPGHPLQRDSDGQIRMNTCTFYGTGKDTVSCVDNTCRERRRADAAAYIRDNNLRFDSEGNLMNASIEEIQGALNTAHKRRAEVEIILKRAQQDVQTYTKQLSDARAREAKERQAKEAWEAEQRQKAQARIRTQIDKMSPDRIAELVAEAGVTRLGPVGQSARSILNEGYSTLLASYWIKNKELNIAAYISEPWAKVEDVEKYQVVLDQDDRYTAVTGVCSVGALALAKAVLNDIPVKPYSEMAERDRGLQIATYALAWAIQTHQGWKQDVHRTAASRIVNWNDKESTQRDEVLEVWKLAEQCPFLDLADDTTLYAVRANGGTVHHGTACGSEQEAQDIIDSIKAAGTSDANEDYLVIEESKVTSLPAKSIVRHYGRRWHKSMLNDLETYAVPLAAPLLATV